MNWLINVVYSTEETPLDKNKTYYTQNRDSDEVYRVYWKENTATTYSCDSVGGTYYSQQSSEVWERYEIPNEVWKGAGCYVATTIGERYEWKTTYEYKGEATATTTTTGGWWSEQYNSYIEPKTSASDDTSAHYQFYSDTTARIDSLKSSVNTFLEGIANKNADITDESKKIRVSIVTFASRSEAESDLTVVDWNSDRTKTKLTDTINNLRASGATRADYGLSTASGILSGAKNTQGYNRNQIVLFFTDGEPTKSSDFEDDVAASAINQAKNMKDSSVTVYSIGIFEDADPATAPKDYSGENSGLSDKEKFNSYMYAVSSNYPNADPGKEWWGELDGTWTLGTKKEGSYYLSASSSSGLSEVFNNIEKEITTGSGSPFAENSYLTFSDTLGNFVEVDGSIKVKIKDDEEYEFVKNDSGVYTCSTENPGITVSVENGVVQVSILSSLVPLKKYETKGGTTTETSAIPLQVTYNVKLVDDLAKQIADDTAGYVNSHKDGDKIYFLTNAVSGSDAQTTAAFTPADGNPYYSADAYTGDTTEKNPNTTSTVAYVSSTSKNTDGTVTTRLGNNGKVSFSIKDVEFTKVDSLATNTALSGAKFTLYTDANCTEGNEVEADVVSDTSGNVKFENILQGTYYLKETKAPDGYKLSSKVYTVEVSSTGTVTIKGGETSVTQITNEPKKIKVKITKMVTGNMGDTTKEFSFTVSSTKALGDSEQFSSNELENTYTKNSQSGDAEFTLKHGYYTYVYVPYGSTITVSESFVDGYETDIRLKDAKEALKDGKYTVTETDDSKIIEIVVTNKNEKAINTGIFDDTTPYFVIIGLVAAGCIAMFIGNKRRKAE